jgi:hypothetical protein
MTFQPHFAVGGRCHVGEESLFSKVSLRVEDSASIFYDFDAFGYASNPRELVKIVLVEESKGRNRPIEMGDQPELAYFSGKREIVRHTTTLGVIVATHNVPLEIGATAGVHLSDRILLTLEFTVPCDFRAVIRHTVSLLRFLEIVAGRPQEIVEFSAQLASDALPFQPLDIHWCARRRTRVTERSPQPGDLPVNGGMDPDQFGRVLANWLAREPTWADARSRYLGCFSRENSYDIDRLVGGANLFDILPADAAPETVTLANDMEVAREEARKLFKALPDTRERSSVLGVLGRLGHASLKHKVGHRANVVLSAFGGRLQRIKDVADEAINCSNHYVHGAAGRIDFGANFFDTVPFFSDTLEFIFGASDFIECGWIPEQWLANGTTMSHPWGAYMVNFPQRLAALMSLLES